MSAIYVPRFFLLYLLLLCIYIFSFPTGERTALLPKRGYAPSSPWELPRVPQVLLAGGDSHLPLRSCRLLIRCALRMRPGDGQREPFLHRLVSRAPGCLAEP